MLYKTTRSLFKGIYQYKIVLVCPGSSLFRKNDNSLLDSLNNIKIGKQSYSHIKTENDLNFALSLAKELLTMQNLDIRVESPWISVYSNSLKDIMTLADIDRSNVKYICKPPIGKILETNTIIMPKIPYEYRVTLGKTIHENSAFVSWAQGNKKIKLTKSCIRELQKPYSWGGAHFYISGNNNLLMAKMHLGGCISKVERILHN